MIDLKDLRADPDRYRRGARAKGSGVDVDELLRLDERVRELTNQRQELAAEKNRIGKEIGAVAGRLKKASAEDRDTLQAQMQAMQRRPAAIKEEEATLTAELAELEPERDARWLRVPQPPDEDVPVGAGSEGNVEVRRWNPAAFDASRPFREQRGFEPLSHIELGQRLGLIDFERGVNIAGSRSYVLTGDGMRLHNAVLQYAFRYMSDENGFQPVSVPVLVREQMMVGTGFFPDGREQAYSVANPTGEEELVLTGTGEVGLMGLHADEIVDEAALPLRLVTLSTCFRREAGAAGKENAGLYRIHQFDKVEQVVICRAEESESRAWHAKMMGYVETLLQRLELPYRLLQCCTGDLGPKNADMIDIETWMPSRGELDADGRPMGAYGETHSASRLYDYQCRRLNLRYREGGEQGKGATTFCHSLNNTVLASPRILIPILELNQNEDGSVTIPKVLRAGMGGREQIG